MVTSVIPIIHESSRLRSSSMTIAEYDTVSISPPTGTVPPAVVPSLGAVISLRLGAAILRTGADRLGRATERPSPLADQLFPFGACIFLSLSILHDAAFRGKGSRRRSRDERPVELGTMGK